MLIAQQVGPDIDWALFVESSKSHKFGFYMYLVVTVNMIDVFAMLVMCCNLLAYV